MKGASATRIAKNLDNYDYTNRFKTRNLDNTDMLDFNCGGAALMTFDGFVPDHERDSYEEGIDEDIEAGLASWEIIDRLLWRDVDEMLHLFSGRLRLADAGEQPRENERLIAYRVALSYEKDDDNGTLIDTDFHFKYMDSDGQWYEKRGFFNPIEKCDLSADSIWECGPYCAPYTSDIVFMMLTKI